MRSLEELGLVMIDKKHGPQTATHAKIAKDLAACQATDAEVDATYQRVLHAIATEVADA